MADDGKVPHQISRMNSIGLGPAPTEKPISLMDQLNQMSMGAAKTVQDNEAMHQAVEKKVTRVRRKSRDLETDHLDGLTFEEMEALQKAFDEYDITRDGTIDQEELKGALIKSGARNVTDAVAKALLKQIDRNNDQLISFEEFKKAFCEHEGR
eukprot:CAMPEP_0206157944 /NCGR_PEP_ID=MMETSP1474-20131121/4382_1 /ASSEMBLY_ACC=CAM_ASM_001110 /TAXON_ID=97495 /ORGANISM="Imantonia sp., Strain RCC918" /LENGTH=152 /DNA_ID=CAMNT_0053557765 /DNA_START=37 /DNA_END=495 /DNA_ORIENTATION=+